MPDLPESLQRLHDVFATATITHEYVAGLHRRLVELDAEDACSRELLQSSAEVVLDQLPSLVRELRVREREWDVQQLLDPDAADRTLAAFAGRLAELEPALAEHLARQGEIAHETLQRLQAARDA